MTAAKEAGFASRRYEFGIYPNSEQVAAMLDQAAMVRSLRNALIAICDNRYKRKVGDETARVTYLLSHDLMDDPELTGLPSENEMHKWVTCLRAADSRWQNLSTHTARRVVKNLHQSWRTFFSNLKKNPVVAGRPKPDHRRVWIPHIHIKRAGEIGSAGSGCELRPAAAKAGGTGHAQPGSGCELRPAAAKAGELHGVAGRNWVLTLKGITGEIHARGQMPTDVIRGRFIDADVMQHNGKWKLSICAHIKRERVAGEKDIRIEFDLIDGMLRVDGRLEIPKGISDAQVMQDRADELQSERDRRWPKRSPWDEEWREADREISRCRSKVAAIRRNALHVWSSRLVSRAASITITKPKVRDNTKSPRGDAKQWGAAVESVSKLNRHVLGQAPAMLCEMLKYKAEEAGIRCDIVEDKTPNIAVGEKLVACGKAMRKAKRAIRRQRDNEHDQQRISGP